MAKYAQHYKAHLLDSEELELGGSFYVGGLDYMDPNLGRWRGDDRESRII